MELVSFVSFLSVSAMMTAISSQAQSIGGRALQTDDLMRLSVDQYHAMIEAGILTSDDPVELLEGWLVRKMPKSPEHCAVNDDLRDALRAVLPPGWFIRSQDPITLGDSEPEPDLCVVRGERADYRGRHPAAAQIGLIAEVADSSLSRDREVKLLIYARAGIPHYWIVNLANRTIEVHSDPASRPEYIRQTIYRMGDSIPVVLDGVTIAALPVATIFGT